MAVLLCRASSSCSPTGCGTLPSKSRETLSETIDGPSGSPNTAGLLRKFTPGFRHNLPHFIAIIQHLTACSKALRLTVPR
jgi:hypothetical protein